MAKDYLGVGQYYMIVNFVVVIVQYLTLALPLGNMNDVIILLCYVYKERSVSFSMC